MIISFLLRPIKSTCTLNLKMMFISKKIFLYINYDATINLKKLSNNGPHLIRMDVDKELCLTI